MKTVEIKCSECGDTYRCEADSQAESSELCAKCWMKKNLGRSIGMALVSHALGEKE